MAATRRPLRSVGKDEQPPPKPKPLTITVAASEGSRRDLLVAMRDRIAKAVEDPNCPARDLAALTRRLDMIAKDIEAIDLSAAEEGHDGHGDSDEAWDESAI